MRLYCHQQIFRKRSSECRFKVLELPFCAIVLNEQFCVPQRRILIPFENASESDRGRIVAYGECSLSVRESVLVSDLTM
ncbi:hypothetical protein TNCV_195291 [Trichonephila clavipes]|uniref:Uncharacterized protein n=1 Tax=Trichonephila clavipes TaxID=2585209 RepID=A0A8X6WJX2_TRICX|nr:hypothetical protein TNCV_195291 [Trichonephila clavipes]